MRAGAGEDGARLDARARYASAALGLLAAGSGLQAYALVVLGPDLARALGLAPRAIVALVVVQSIAVALAVLPVAAAVASGPRRALVCVVAGGGWTAAMVVAALSAGAWGLVLALLAGGAAAASVPALHPSLVVDCAAPGVRVRALSAYRSAGALGAAAGAVLVVVLTDAAGLTWRSVLLALGGLSLLGTLMALGLRDPGAGRLDGERLRSLLGASGARAADAALSLDPPILAANPRRESQPSADRRLPKGTTLRVRRRSTLDAAHDRDSSTIIGGSRLRPGVLAVARGLLAVTTVRRLLAGYVAAGALAIPLAAYVPVFLEDRWGLGLRERGAVAVAALLVTVAVLALFAGPGDRLLARGPATLLGLAWWTLLAAAAALVGVVTVPLFAVTVAALCAAFAGLALAQTAVAAVLMTIVAPGARPHAAALGGLALVGAEAIVGIVLLGGLADELGTGATVACLAAVAAGAALVLSRGCRTADPDLAEMVDGLLDDAQADRPPAENARMSAVECRGVVVAYGHRRALDAVDLTVERGELIVVLGTNGAGKSTLLRVVSGLARPDAGAVRLGGVNVTLLDAQRRVGLGVAHVAGEGSVFDPLTVRESLALAAHAAGMRGARARTAAERALEWFPVLAARAGGRVATLSGAERQMLALGQALVRSPRLLLVDELSRGLVPAAVEQALEAVRALHAAGTTMVIVEQSADLALSLAPRALFLERGRVCFDGPSAVLRTRDDLLRPVFLAGAVAP
jgi:ABC-type branched-subunit amino acid transport system ATPase component